LLALETCPISMAVRSFYSTRASSYMETQDSTGGPGVVGTLYSDKGIND
jgi:hypothetical protein